ncbi:M64 family metallopeptidase [Ginsengibacter hankyongi]|uniref:M64 family metallopeptidase n=1 Tax=Ginsengibacter hankyongi TaxID=2607284 RepID=UPI00192887A7|nr:M64 family metallopeptidase [Ginsengibacter hankyongi]
MRNITSEFLRVLSSLYGILLLLAISPNIFAARNEMGFASFLRPDTNKENRQKGVNIRINRMNLGAVMKRVDFKESLLNYHSPFQVRISKMSDRAPSENKLGINIDSVLKKVELIPIMINGDKNNRINIVIMNRWTSKDKDPYNSQEMKKVFLNDINESLIAALTPGNSKAQTAYANYRQFFNVYALWWPDIPEWDKGVDISVADSLRNRLFLPWKDENTGWVTILAMPNVRNGGGGAGRNLEDRIGDAVIAGNGIGKMLHEISHTCGSLGDEYSGPQSGTSQFPTYNSTIEYRRDKIKWRKWIDTSTPLPTPYTEEYMDKVGAFEGNQYHLANYFRSTAQGCIMGAGVFDNTEKMCPICEQRLAMRVYSLVNPINSFYPSENEITINGETVNHFAIDHISPEPNTQVVRWSLNGKIIAIGTDSVNIKFGSISDYELICTLTDETSLIRPDPPYAQYPKREIRWNIHNLKPVSPSHDLEVKIEFFNRVGKSTGKSELRSVVSGGKPPYSYKWSTGDTMGNLNNAIPGIYNLLVTDSEFRMKECSYSVYGNHMGIQSFKEKSQGIKNTSGILKVNENTTASDKNCDNGKIELQVKGGTEPYSFVWADEKCDYTDNIIYEAENASLAIPGHITKNYFGASNNTYVSFNGNEGFISWKIDVAKEGVYPIDIIYGSTGFENSQVNMSVNGGRRFPININSTRPLNTGWDEVSLKANLKQGANWVTLSSCGQSGPNIDYLRVPASFNDLAVIGKERNNLRPGHYKVLIKDSKGNAIVKSIFVNEADSFTITKPELVKVGKKSIAIKDPLPGFTYEWYQNDAPLFYQEKFEEPLVIGNEFSPVGPGNYFIAEKNNQTNAESSNRIGIAIGKSNTGDGFREINPLSLGKKDIVLWLDANDVDANAKKNSPTPGRGPINWKDKISPELGQLLVNYKPNELNGKGVCGFDDVWVQSLGKEATGFRTIIMVYKESDMSYPGKSPFIGLSKYIGKSSDTRERLFDPQVADEKTKEGKTYLNGKRVDPFLTPNPMDYCILIVELGSKATDSIMKTEGYWEGSLAEILLLNRLLSESERKGIEEYLRKKWISSVDLDF